MEGRLFTRTREMHITVEGEEKKEKTRNIENQYNLGECHRNFPDLHENDISKETHQRS